MHGAITKPLTVASVLTEGYAGNLAKGQLAFIGTKTKKGLGAEVISDFDGLTSKDLISIRVGEHTSPGNLRINEVKSQSTGYFKLGSIVDIKAYAPTNVTLKVDHIELGYDGITDISALNIPEGKSAVMDIVLYGEVASMFFGRSEYMIQKRAYREVGESMQKVIERLVKEINEDKVPAANGFTSTMDSLSQFLEVKVINSEATPVTGEDSTFSTLTVRDSGDSNDLAEVASQYNDFKVTRTDRLDDEYSVYTILHLASETLGDFVKTSVGSTIKGCADCQAGYKLVEGGFISHVSLEDNEDDLTATVQAIPGAVAGSAVKFGNKDGKGVYSVILTDELTAAEAKTFLDANVTAELKSLGEVKDICAKTPVTETYSWKDDKTCVATTVNYTITLPDNECGQTRLPELQKAFPELTIAAGTATGGCKRTYTTSVKTNIVCKECSDIYLQPFYAEDPEPFENIYWEAKAKKYSDVAKMGISIKGKPFYIYPEAHEEDFIPFLETSLKVRSASFGWREDDILNFTGSNYDADLEYAKVVKLQYAQDVDNLSESFFGAERMGHKHFTNKTVYKGNLFTRANLSLERILKYHKRILRYHIQYRDQTLSQGGGGRSDITHDIMLMVEYGKHSELENIVNKLASKSGLPAVKPAV